MEDDAETGSANEQQSDQGDSGDDDSGDGDWGSEGGGASESGLHFGLRLGYGFPLGKATGTASSSGGTGGTTTTTGSGDLSDSVAGQIPIWVDLGWQFSPKLMAGAYFSYGFVLPSGDLADACDAARADCTLSDIRLGLQAQYNFAPGRGTDPWLGIGVGYEWFKIAVNDATFTFHGWELPMLQGGVDFGGDSGGSTIGPFVAFTFGRFTRGKVEFGSISESGDIDDVATHNWLFVGVRGVVK